MEYTTLGNTGMTVSRLCLGCMSFGSSNWREWVLDEEESRPIIDRAVELGITFFDTANMYSNGESERVLGNALKGYDRDEMIVASKAYYAGSSDPHPNETGLSRKTVDQELQKSLDRLGVETIDLYQTHRWDYDTPIEETLRALDDAVRRNDLRYIGTSSQWAYQFADALQTSDRLGVERFVSMQNHYNLTYREEEREMLPLCENEGIGVVPWSPLARGYLTRPDSSFRDTTRGRFMDETDRYARRIAAYRANGGIEINERVEELATAKGVTMAQIALAWILHKDWVTAPIIGPTSIEHLEDAVEAIEISLSDGDIDYLEEPYGPVEIVGHE